MFLFLKSHRLQPLVGLVAGLPGPVLELGQLQLEALPVEHKATQFDLTLTIVDDGERLAACWEYDATLFESATIDRMQQHFGTLLAAIVDDPQCPIAVLPLLSARERQLLLVDWNNTRAGYSRDRCAHQLFETQAALTPCGRARRRSGGHLSGLNASANRVAHHLIRRGSVGGADRI